MEKKRYFAFYESFLDQLETLDDETQLKFYKAITNYAIRGIEPEFTGLELFAWVGLKNDIDNQRARSEDTKERNSKYYQSKKSENTEISENSDNLSIFKKNSVSENSEKNLQEVSENLSKIQYHGEGYGYGEGKGYGDIEGEETSVSDEPLQKNKKNKPSKHKNGPYDNVLLTDTELSQLNERFKRDTEPIINNFSELKAMKGYTYKSDYLAILKWGADAYYKQKQNAPAPQPNNAQAEHRCASCGEPIEGGVTSTCKVCGYPAVFEHDMQMITGFQLVKEKYPKESWKKYAEQIFAKDTESERCAVIHELLGHA